MVPMVTRDLKIIEKNDSPRVGEEKDDLMPLTL